MILVTGGTGFLGAELVKQLVEHGYRVRAIKRKDSTIPPILSGNTSVEWIEADMLDYFALEKSFEDVTEIYHCAALVSFDPADKKKMLSTNTEGTANIVNLCLEKNIKKLVHVSSIAAIGEEKEGRLITEDNHWQFTGNQNTYAISKYKSEMEVWRGIAEGLNAVIVNPSVIIGKHAGKKGSGAIFNTVRRGLKFYTGGSCGLIDVEDVAKCMIILMKSDITNERFILNAENRSFYSLFTETAQNLNIKPPSIKARPWMLGIAWRTAKIAGIITGRHYGLTRDTAQSAFIKQNYSNEKIKKTIEIEFKPINKSIAEICSVLNQTS